MMPFAILLFLGACTYLLITEIRKQCILTDAEKELKGEELERKILKIREDIALLRTFNKEEEEAIKL